MELSFLYIQKFGQVENMGLNFSSKFRYNYNASTKKLEVVKINDYSDRFYKDYQAEITSLSAIVGQNGVGKTTILNFIKHNFTDGTGGVYSPCLVGIYDKEADKHDLFYYEIEQPTTTEDSIPVVYKKLVRHRIPSNDFETYESINAFEDLTFINYSGLLDLAQIEGEYGASFNITTNYLAHTASTKQTGEDHRFHFNEIEVFRTQEVERQLRFYSKYKDLLPFGKPKYIEIKINRFNQLQLNKDLYEKWLLYNNEVQKLEKLGNRTPEEEEDFIKYKDWVDLLIVYNSLISNLIEKIDSQWYRSFKSDVYKQLLFSFLKGRTNYINFLPHTIANLKQVIEKIDAESITSSGVLKILFDYGDVSVLPQEQQDRYIDFSNILPHIEKIIEASENKGAYEDHDYLMLNSENESILFEFLKFQTNITNSSFVEFFWPLSNGQQTLFSMYSRFYDIIHRTKQFDNIEVKNNILILLDEAEISLHPEWQRSFLENFLSMITTLFAGKKIQIIITTHSPFLLSDLLLSQVNFLELNENTNKGKVVENPILEKKSTFGANISTLLHDAFFMKNGFLGSIALHQMDEFIDFILKSEISVIKEQYEYVDWFIHQIGEPLIRNKMIQILESRLSVDLLNTTERLEKIEQRLNKLENPQDDQN